MIILKSYREIQKMREAGRVVAQAHQLIKGMIEPGVSTLALDLAVADFIHRKGGTSSFLNYHGFPAHTCISVNEELVHGIPSAERCLAAGDIVTIDIGVILDGYHGDSAWSYGVGEISAEKQRLFAVTEAALWDGIAQATRGNRLSDISRAVQKTVEAAGMHVAREYVGHGIGRSMHEEPQLPNYWLPSMRRGPRLRSGMTLAIEPMVLLGTHETEVLADDWTVISADHSPTAHFEHTVAITPDGPQILTLL
ncbi:MAG: type I methionyl aminopeptidase [Anaerolineales bacterium]|nr:type I methionyl aminopeptidase [Anaerolineales bacterium]MCB9127217.1 type I methionyl aminopeptidase [Ardenticatenales bacterium]MCB9171973.1 type I methionyl aminopeptidase [Ardenticatenales bacterium]